MSCVVKSDKAKSSNHHLLISFVCLLIDVCLTRGKKQKSKKLFFLNNFEISSKSKICNWSFFSSLKITDNLIFGLANVIFHFFLF